MTTSEKHTLLLSAAEALIILVLSLLLFNAYRKPTDVIEVPIEVKDTITVTQERIVEHTRTQYVTLYDTTIVYLNDTDTVQIPIQLPIEHKVYEDTLRTDTTEIGFKVLYSGFETSLDEIEVNYHYKSSKAVEVKKKSWGQFVGFGLYGGAGFGYDALNKNLMVGPEVGVGIVYGFGYRF